MLLVVSGPLTGFFIPCPSCSHHWHPFEKMAGTHMVPEVVGTMGMSSASVGMDQGI